MKVLDLFAGTKGWSAAFADRGHEVFAVELDPSFPGIDYVGDVRDLRVADLPYFDIVLASPPCTAFTTMTMGRNWTHDGEPKTDSARLGRDLVQFTRELLFGLNPAFFIIGGT